MCIFCCVYVQQWFYNFWRCHHVDIKNTGLIILAHVFGILNHCSIFAPVNSWSRDSSYNTPHLDFRTIIHKSVFWCLNKGGRCMDSESDNFWCHFPKFVPSLALVKSSIVHVNSAKTQRTTLRGNAIVRASWIQGITIKKPGDFWFWVAWWFTRQGITTLKKDSCILGRPCYNWCISLWFPVIFFTRFVWQSEDGLQRDRNQVENSHDPYYCPHNGE